MENKDNHKRLKKSVYFKELEKLHLDLYKAKEWATIAWGKYKEKESKEYGYILTQRIQETENINYQMNR